MLYMQGLKLNLMNTRITLCYFLFFLSANHMLCQEIFDIDLPDRRIHIGITASPNISNRTLDGNSPNVDIVINQRDNFEKYKVSYNLGASLLIPTGEKFSLETGLRFTDKGYSISEMFFFWPQPDPNLAISGRANINLLFLDVPMLVRFTLGDKKVRFITRIGATANLLLSETERQIFTFQNGSQDISTRNGSGDYKTFNISPTVSFGLEYEFSNQFHLQLAPEGMITILNATNRNIKERLWNVGMNIGLYYKI